MNVSKKKVAIISSCTEDWGGSEELWGRTIPFLQDKGYGITVYKSHINLHHPEFSKLSDKGVRFRSFGEHKPFITRNFLRVLNKLDSLRGRDNFFTFINNPWVNNLIKLLKKNKPAFAVISQGINFDGLGYGYACRLLQIPYVIIAQKAVDFYWPGQHDRPEMKKILKDATACYFVSKHNLRLTEEQFGERLTNAHVIFNPLKIGSLLPYPDTNAGFRLACVGRLFVLDKGQDLLIRILSSKKWKERPVHITFAGTGVDEAALKEMAKLLDVKNISFAGQITDINSLWQQHHALILPSRSEGLPLSMVEAMAAGRIAITSKAGGNTELIEENVTAFSGYPNETSFEEAMERAWEKREQWAEMGREAARQITAVVPSSPEREFANHLFQYMDKAIQ